MPKILLCMLVLLLSLCPLASEQFPVPQLPFAPLTYYCYRASGSITIDGSLNETDWQSAPATDSFVDIEGMNKPLPYLNTRVKMLWDDQGLCIEAELNEPHLWATLTERDAVIFHDNDFEVFIDPDGDTHDYYELELNALGTLWDLFLVKPYRDRQHVAVNAWDIRGIEHAVKLNGTLNNPQDRDQGWTVELRLPWKVLSECAHKPVPPVDGDYWRINFSRVQWQTEIVDGRYQKLAGVPEANWVWSPQGLVAMHYPERWGLVYFSGQTPHRETAYPPLPAVEIAKEYLRQLYYRQKQYWLDKGRYANGLKPLDAQAFVYQGKKYRPSFAVTPFGYVISLPKSAHWPALHIREDGLNW